MEKETKFLGVLDSMKNSYIIKMEAKQVVLVVWVGSSLPNN